MKLKLWVSVLSVLLPVVACAETTITFDNQTGKSPSTARIYIGTAGPGPCSTSAMVQKMTGKSGITQPKETNVVSLSNAAITVLCRNHVCKADLYMNDSCQGSPLTTVTLPLGGASTVSQSLSADGKYSFAGLTDGVVMTCADGTDNC